MPVPVIARASTRVIPCSQRVLSHILPGHYVLLDQPGPGAGRDGKQ